MKDVNWRAIDLNLLIVFDALMETRSVTRAADKVAVGQSAMSHSLARLRTLLDDPLFIRQGHEMVPTARAKEVAPVIEEVLNTITHRILKSAHFDPAAFTGSLRIGLTDYAELIFAPALFDRLIKEAPGCQLSFRPVDRENYQKALNDNDVDVVIGAMEPENTARFSNQKIYEEQHVCLFDAEATGLCAPIPLSDYLLTPHALVTADGRLQSPVDKTLSEMGFSRHVAMGSQRFLTVRRLLKGRNLLCIVAELMARIDSFDDNLVLSPPPIPVANFDIRLIWRTSDSSNPRINWLREQVTQTIEYEVSRLRNLH
ncbi:LysR family transcriptional regulator [Parasalinivibrio latis]|uniref:LysR family transcriptional regulator n=1 Tax=Parasalinivibrio latis TaxID=2952610 RepID=UPI0030E26BBA